MSNNTRGVRVVRKRHFSKWRILVLSVVVLLVGAITLFATSNSDDYPLQWYNEYLSADYDVGESYEHVVEEYLHIEHIYELNLYNDHQDYPDYDIGDYDVSESYNYIEEYHPHTYHEYHEYNYYYNGEISSYERCPYSISVSMYRFIGSLNDVHRIHAEKEPVDFRGAYYIDGNTLHVTEPYKTGYSFNGWLILADDAPLAIIPDTGLTGYYSVTAVLPVEASEITVITSYTPVGIVEASSFMIRQPRQNVGIYWVDGPATIGWPGVPIGIFPADPGKSSLSMEGPGLWQATTTLNRPGYIFLGWYVFADGFPGLTFYASAPPGYHSTHAAFSPPDASEVQIIARYIPMFVSALPVDLGVAIVGFSPSAYTGNTTVTNVSTGQPNLTTLSNFNLSMPTSSPFFFTGPGNAHVRTISGLGPPPPANGVPHTATVEIGPRSNPPVPLPPLGHGNFSETVTMYMPFDNVPPVPPRNLGSFEVTFRVERPIRRVVLLNQDRTIPQIDARLNARDVWPSTSVVAPGYLPDVTLPYTYQTPGNPRESHITVTIPTPDEWTFFHDRIGTGNSYYYSTIKVVPPMGYVEVPNTRTHISNPNNNGIDYLVITLMPRTFSFEFFKTCILIEENPLGPLFERNPRPGAVFRLDWDLGSGFVEAYTTQPSNSQGLVSIGNLVDLILPAPLPGSTMVQLRLEEITPPTGGYALPEYHWYIIFNKATWAVNIISNSLNGANDPEFVLRELVGGGSIPISGINYGEIVGQAPHYIYDCDGYDCTCDLIDGTSGEIGIAPTETVYRWHVGNRRAVHEPDWRRLNHAINHHEDEPEYIVIWPAYGAPGNGIHQEDNISGNVFNLVISDPNPIQGAGGTYTPGGYGFTITTLPIGGNRPPEEWSQPHPHAIYVQTNRNVTIQAAPNTTIYLRMNMAGSPNTTNSEPWGTPPAALGRHFVVYWQSGLTLGGAGSGTLVIDGNVANMSLPVPTDIYRGGIWVLEQGTLVIDDGATIINNSALLGGGVSTNWNATVSMNGGIIGDEQANFPDGNVSPHGNRAYRGGGGVAVMLGSSFHMEGTGGRIIGNHAYGDNGRGGGVYVYAVGTTFRMEAGTIERNYSEWGGGGVIVEGGARFDMEAPAGGPGGLIHENASEGFGGGGVLVRGERLPTGAIIRSEFNMSGGEITSNSALGDSAGGGVLLIHGGVFNMLAPNDDNFPHRIAYNRVYSLSQNQGGGGVEIWWEWVDGTVMNMYGGIIERNYARHGGGIFLEGGELNMFGGYIRYNRYDTDGNPVLYGGGVKVGNDSSVDFNMHGGAIYNNQAYYGGGVRMLAADGHHDVFFDGMPAALSVSRSANFNMHDGDIHGNEAIANGGGVWVSHQNSVFNMTGGTIGGDLDRANTAESGGGVWVEDEARMYMNEGSTGTSGTISHNYATGTSHNQGGGGVFIYRSRFNMNAGSIRYNFTRAMNETNSGNGGGVHIRHASYTIYMTGGDISYNVSTRSGGGIFIYDSLVRVRASDVDNPPIIRGNTAPRSGGGVAVYNYHFVLDSGLICSNGHEQNHPYPMPGSIFYTNGITTRDGGGIRGSSATIQLMNRAMVQRNTANRGGGISLGGFTEPSFSYCSCCGEDLLSDAPYAYLHFEGGMVGGSRDGGYGNTATVSAQGYMLASDGTTEIADGNGGGIWLGAGATAFIFGAGAERRMISPIGSEIDWTIEQRRITGNTAYAHGDFTTDGGGGGIYVTYYAHLNIAHSTVNYNWAPYGLGGGIFTEMHEYANPITDVYEAFGNIILSVINQGEVPNDFHGNSASILVSSPTNAGDLVYTDWNNNEQQRLPYSSNTSQPASILDPYRHPLNNYDINFIASMLFEFLKTDYQIYDDPYVVNLLENAQFILVRTPAEDFDFTTGQVTFTAGVPDLPWVRVPNTSPSIVRMTSTLNNDEPVAFYISPGFVYHLIEVVPPSGFQLPGVEWRIQFIDGEFDVSTIGTSWPATPLIRLSVCDCLTPECARGDIEWVLGNHREFQLPLTGGSSIMIFIASGTILLAAAGALAIAIIKRKHMYNKKQLRRF